MKPLPTTALIEQELTCLNDCLASILGVGVSALSALRDSESLIDRGDKGYVCVTGVHGIMEAQSDEQFRKILNGSFLTTPDGMPTVWLGHLKGSIGMAVIYACLS